MLRYYEHSLLLLLPYIQLNDFFLLSFSYSIHSHLRVQQEAAAAIRPPSARLSLLARGCATISSSSAQLLARVIKKLACAYAFTIMHIQ